MATPYVNTVSTSEEPRYPGDLELERRLRSLIRWNAMAMVVRANREHEGIGGHISTYASCATLFEVACHHLLEQGDLVYFQGHASPGIYARAFLEGRLDARDLERFRRELAGGLPSYPHPRLMPAFWQFPTVSMGLGPICAVYAARYLRYLQARGLADTGHRKVWCFVGDGECDEPETMAGLSIAAREKLDNLVFVVSCNLQRLDGPVRGNGKIIQELEDRFAGAGWDVFKVIWSQDWDPLLEADDSGALLQRMEETVDGDYQRYSAADGAEIREDFFGASEELRGLVDHLTDDQLERLRRGGHDPVKVYAAYRAALDSPGPAVVLAKTVKGYGLGEAGEGRNITHKQKELNEDELREFRGRFGVPIGDDQLAEAPFYRPPDDSPEIRYLVEHREELGGPLPVRTEEAEAVAPPGRKPFEPFLAGSDDRPASTTMALVRLLSRLLDDDVGERLVPIVPDEARTFGLDPLFQKYGIYAARGQQYQPVDQGNLLYYREAEDGILLEEGITEAGSMASFIAAGTAYSTVGVETLPFYLFYSMFGFQRVGDLIWAAGDAKSRGFLIGGTAGRTTLNGEGLQHQDGHSQLLATTVPSVVAYDAAYAHELATIVEEGMRRMLGEREDVMFYLTVYNETYAMPPQPEGSREGILRGMYRLTESGNGDDRRWRPQLLGSGPLLREALRARDILADFGVDADVWSVTSYQQLRADALACEEHNRHHPDDPRLSYLERVTAGRAGPYVAVSDWISMVPEQIARFLPGPLIPLGTDGYGRSDTREALRRYFGVDAESIAHATLVALAHRGDWSMDDVTEARDQLGL